MKLKSIDNKIINAVLPNIIESKKEGSNRKTLINSHNNYYDKVISKESADIAIELSNSQDNKKDEECPIKVIFQKKDNINSDLFDKNFKIFYDNIDAMKRIINYVKFDSGFTWEVDLEAGDVIQCDFGAGIGSEKTGRTDAIVIKHSNVYKKSIIVMPIRFDDLTMPALKCASEYYLGKVTQNKAINVYVNLAQTRYLDKHRIYRKMENDRKLYFGSSAPIKLSQALVDKIINAHLDYLRYDRVIQTVKVK